MERFTIGDAAELAGDVGPDPRLIAVLVELDGTVDTGDLRATVADRAAGLPLLTHRLVRRDGIRTPHWEQVAIDPAQHVLEIATDDPVGSTTAVLVAGLPETIPMWRLLVLRSSDTCHLLFVAHHVLLDGVTALTVVSALFGSPLFGSPPQPPVAPAPRRAWLAPLAAINVRTSATSLLAPLSSGFRLVTVEEDLERMRSIAHRAGATINDLLLLAVADALRAAARQRGERLRRVVVSVPVTIGAADGEPSRNRVGGFLVSVPERRGGETDTQLLGRLAARTRRRKWLARAPSGSTALSATLVALGRTGWYRPLFEHQRAIVTLVTNLRGPVAALTVMGARVRSLTPISPTLGNVGVVVAALSYAGRLRITARLDRAAWDIEATFVDALRSALSESTAEAGNPASAGDAEELSPADQGLAT